MSIVRAEIDDEQPVIVARPEEAHARARARRASRRRGHRFPGARWSRRRAAAAGDRRAGARNAVRDRRCHRASRQASNVARALGSSWRVAASAVEWRELAQELEPAARDVARELSFVVREVHERCRRSRLLTLKQERRRRSEQQQRRQRPQRSWRGELAEPESVGRIGDLVVVLEKMDELRGARSRAGCAAALALPRVSLSLEQEPALRCRQELLTRPPKVTVVRLANAGQRDAGRVVEVVVVEGVQPVSSARRGPHQAGVLPFVLGDDDDAAAARGGARAAHERGEDVVGRRVEDLVRGVEPEAVEVILANPVLGAGEDELARGLRARGRRSSAPGPSHSRTGR